MKLNHLVFLLSILFIGIPAFAQKSCLNTLREAKDLYEKGLIDEIPTLMTECMESGFTRAQRIEAYKLIILAYLFDDDQFAAERTMDEFLKKFPEYEVMPNDPVEFVYLLESYKTSSYYSINLTFGPTFTDPQIIESFSARDIANTDYADKMGMGYHFGLGFSRNLFKSFNGNIAVNYFSYQYSFVENTILMLGGAEYESGTVAEEEITRFDFPMTLTYNFGRGNLHYDIRAGALIGYTYKANLSLSRTQTELDNSVSNPNINLIDFRQSLNYAAVVGAGLEYKIPRGYLVLDVRYRIGLTDITVADSQYDPVLYSRYFHVDDKFRLNCLSIAIGYHFSIYQSKKNRF
jgi:hypothetical protein